MNVWNYFDILQEKSTFHSSKRFNKGNNNKKTEWKCIRNANKYTCKNKNYIYIPIHKIMEENAYILQSVIGICPIESEINKYIYTNFLFMDQ